jgi:acyl-CoA thioesterase-1
MRQSKVFLIVAGTLLTIAGCRSETASPGDRDALSTQPAPVSSAAAATPAPVDQPARKPELDPRPVIACFGDSLTAGYGADEGQAYPDFLQQDLDRAGYRYRVVNEGISGNTTKDGVDRLSEVVALHPAVVVLEFGGNDGLRGLKTQTTRTNLAQMIETLKASGDRVVLAGITLPPDYGPDYVNAFTANYPALARKYDIPLLPFILKNVYGVPGLMQADNIHATDQGNAVVARNLLPYIEPLLKK